jgi:sulfatase maturation enzyme AslB (radical SAM superfamily)
VSLDGAMIESNDRIRGAGTFSRAMRGINHLRNNGIPFSIYFTLNGQNVSDIVKIFPLAEKLGTTGVRINDISFLGSAKKNKRLLVVRNKKYKDIIINYLRRDGRHLNKANGCSVSKDSVFLSPQGRMYPCVHLYQSNAACGLGNIQKFNMALYNTYVSGLERIKDKSCPYTIYNSRRYSWCENKGNTCCLK